MFTGATSFMLCDNLSLLQINWIVTKPSDRLPLWCTHEYLDYFIPSMTQPRPMYLVKKCTLLL